MAESVLEGSAALEPEERSSNFFLSFLFLSKARRRALSALYRYCRLIDDIVDSEILSKEEAEADLSFWELELGRLFEGRPTHPAARALLGPIREFGLEIGPFREVIRGCRMDLGPARYETFADLESYMDGVAGAVGAVSVEIFGYCHTPKPAMRQFAMLFGRAFQLTNIIRDVGADLSLGRIYIPDSELARAGLPREDLARRRYSREFGLLMEGLYARARDLYRQARTLVDPRDKRGLVAAEVMARVYEALLEKMRSEGFKVLFGKTELSGAAKLRQALRAWLYCHGL